MKLGKATIYVHDSIIDSPISSLKQVLDNTNQIYYELFDIKETEIGEWHDDIPINKIGATKSVYEKYFDTDMELIVEMAKNVYNILKTEKYTGIDLNKSIEFVTAKNRKLNEYEKELFEEQVNLLIANYDFNENYDFE
jgi:hypothetical protein